MATDTLTTGRLAALAGINLETVRFYERRGLIAKPARSASGYRQYPISSVIRLRFIKRAQELGFSLQEISDLLSLRATPGGTSTRVKKLTEQKLEIIDDKIRDLRRMHRTLAALAAACDGCGPVADCPIIHALEEDR